VAAIKGAQLEARLGSSLLVVDARSLEGVRIESGDGDERGELELCVAGDQFRLPILHRTLCSSVAGTDAETRAGSLLLVGRQPGGIALDRSL
jgi:hypothetical protein